MKKALALVMSACLAFSLVACGGETTSTSTAASSEAASSEAASSEAAAPAAEAGVKTGMAIVSKTSTSDADADAEGKAQVDSTVAAVLVGEDGKIISCKLDVAQNKVAVAADGSFENTAEFQSKQELKEKYNMKPASPIGKEWYEQANAFADYLVGKTAEEVRAIEVGGDHNGPVDADIAASCTMIGKEWYEQANAFADYLVGKTAEEVRAIEVGGDHNGPVDADIAASCTMSVTDMIEAVAQAVESAQVLGATAEDTLGLGVNTEMSHYNAIPADNEGEGSLQTDTTYAAVTYGADGKITSSIWDCTQAKFSTTEEGAVAAKDAEIVSKQNLQDKYGMKPASPIGKEWFEQAQAYAAWMVGKTAEDVKAIEVGGDHNGPVDADIAASCTMDVLQFNGAVEKALA